MGNLELIDVPENSSLNLEGKPNVPLCPMCTDILGTVESNYSYKRSNPDTRWFWCEHCSCHLGYYRMKKKWKIDPYDLDTSQVARDYFGLGPVEIE